jgi:hypothetical protein
MNEPNRFDIIIEAIGLISIGYLFFLLIPLLVLDWIYRKVTPIDWKLKRRKRMDGYVFQNNIVLGIMIIIGYVFIPLLAFYFYFREDKQISWGFLVVIAAIIVAVFLVIQNAQRLFSKIYIFPGYFKFKEFTVDAPYTAYIEQREYDTGNSFKFNNYLIVQSDQVPPFEIALRKYGLTNRASEIHEALNRIADKSSVMKKVNLPRVSWEERIQAAEGITDKETVKKRMLQLFYYPMVAALIGGALGFYYLNLPGFLSGVFIGVGAYSLIKGEILMTGGTFKGTKARLIASGFMLAGILYLALIYYGKTQ